MPFSPPFWRLFVLKCIFLKEKCVLESGGEIQAHRIWEFSPNTVILRVQDQYSNVKLKAVLWLLCFFFSSSNMTWSWTCMYRKIILDTTSWIIRVCLCRLIKVWTEGTLGKQHYSPVKPRIKKNQKIPKPTKTWSNLILLNLFLQHIKLKQI